MKVCSPTVTLHLVIRRVPAVFALTRLTYGARENQHTAHVAGGPSANDALIVNVRGERLAGETEFSLAKIFSRTEGRQRERNVAVSTCVSFVAKRVSPDNP